MIAWLQTSKGKIMISFEIFYKDLGENDFPSLDTACMVKEFCSGNFVETYFENCGDMVEYVDKEKLLKNNTDAFQLSIRNVI